MPMVSDAKLFRRGRIHEAFPQRIRTLRAGCNALTGLCYMRDNIPEFSRVGGLKLEDRLEREGANAD